MAMQVNGGPMAVPVVASTAGAAFDCRAMGAKTVSLEGSFTATYRVEISCDPSDSPNANSWSQATTSTLTAAGNIFVQQPAAWIRWFCTAYTAGTPVGRVAGMTSFS